MRTASATAVSGSDTVDSASTRVVPVGHAVGAQRDGIAAGPDAELDADADRVGRLADVDPALLVDVDRAHVGLADAEMSPGQHGLDALLGVGLDPPAGGDTDLHAGHLRADGGDGVADVGGVERLLLVGAAGVHVHRGDAELRDGAGVAGKVSGEDGKRGMRVRGPRPVQNRLKHGGTPNR